MNNPIIKLNRCLEVFRTISPTLPVSYVSLILTVALEGRITQAQLSNELGLPRATVSRALLVLSKWERKGVPGLKDIPGLDLLQSEIDPADRRMRIISLTSRGKMVINNLKAILGERLGNDTELEREKMVPRD